MIDDKKRSRVEERDHSLDANQIITSLNSANNKKKTNVVRLIKKGEVFDKL